MKTLQGQSNQKNSCASPLTTSSYNGESSYSDMQQDFSKGMQNYEDNNFDRYGYNQKMTRKIDLNRTSNINTMLGNNRSTSRNSSPSQQDSNRFISFKKTLTYEQSKQQRNSVTQSEKSQWDNESKNRSNNNLSTSQQRYTPLKMQQQQLEQQQKKEKSSSVKVITLQLEKEKNKGYISQSRQELQYQNDHNLSEIQRNQNYTTVDDMYDFTAQKNSSRDYKKNNQQRLSLNEQTQGNSEIGNENADTFQNKVLNKQQDISFDSYLDKKKSMKPEFSKIDQKFDKYSNSQNIYNISSLQNNEISEEFENNNYLRVDKYNSSIQKKLINNNQKNQSVEQNNDYKEFEELEQNIFKDELENKEKYLLSKGIKQKKSSNYSSSIIGNNYQGNITPTTDSLYQVDSDVGTKELRSSDFGAKDIRSSAFGGETDNSLTSSVKPEQNRNSLLNAMKGLNAKQTQKQPSNNQQGFQKNQFDSQHINSEINEQNKKTEKIIHNIDHSKNGKSQNITPTKPQQKQQQQQQQYQQIQNENQQKTFNLNDQQKIDQEDNTKQRINTSKKNTIAQFCSVLDKNIQPSLQISKSQHQLNYISECSKKLYLESQEIGINQKSRENIALFKQALDARNKLLKSMQVTSKLTSPSQIKLEKQNNSVLNQNVNGITNTINSVNQNIINSNIDRGSQTTRKNEISSFSNLQNADQQYNNNQNYKTQISSPQIKYGNKGSNTSGIISENQKGKEYENKVRRDSNNQKGKAFENKQQNNGNYFIGSHQNINSIQNIVSKTDLGAQSQLQLEESNLGSGLLLQSNSQKYFNDQKNNKMIQSPTFKNQENSKSKTMSKKNKSDNITKSSEQTNDSECQQDYYFDQSDIQSQFNNRKSYNDKRESNERKSYISANNTTSSTHYNFINEKSNIINKISGSYKFNEKSNISFEKSFNLIAPSKSTVTRQIQLGASNLDKNQNGGDSNRKDTSFSRKQNNSSMTRQKSSQKQIQSSQQNSQSGQQLYSQLNSQSNSSITNIEEFKEQSGRSTLQNTQTQLKDTIKSQSKLDVNLKTPTVQTNLSMPNGKVEKQRNSQNNASNTSLSKMSKSNHDVKEIQIVPSQNSAFNFKPSYFTPLNNEDINDYMEYSKRNLSPQYIKK